MPTGTVMKKDTVKKKRKASYASEGRDKSFGGERSVKLIMKGAYFCPPTGDPRTVSKHFQVKIQFFNL
jgi:hypothetical protein